MTNQFNQYAKFYDLLYADKDYEAESKYISDLVKSNYLAQRPGDIKLLDLACGTGRHVFELKKLGYDVEGSDVSSQMINIAKQKASENKNKIEFHNYSFQEINKLDKKYDVVTSMFSAVNYITTDDDLRLSFSNIKSILKKGGLFIFDFWNGLAVARDYSPVRVLRKARGNEEILRVSRTEIDILKQSAKVEFSCLYFSHNLKEEEFYEVHNLRYFYINELKMILEVTGFEVIYTGPFMEAGKDLEPFDWNISMIAKLI